MVHGAQQQEHLDRDDILCLQGGGLEHPGTFLW